MNDYFIPREGPIEGSWERIVNVIDWVCIGLLTGCCMGMLITSIWS